MKLFKFVRKKTKEYKFQGENNRLYIVENNVKKESYELIPGLEILMRGQNNTIIVEKPVTFLNSKISVRCSNSVIYISSTTFELNTLYIELAQPCTNQQVYISKNVSINGASMYVYGNDALLHIGEDCMFSTLVKIMTGDGHRLIDRANGKILNSSGSTVKIGNHVWVGRDVTICKGVSIPDNTVIGTGSLVTKSFDEEYTILAGRPANVIKRNVEWDREENF